MGVVLGLLLYSISARDPQAPRNVFDWMQVVLVISALLVDWPWQLQVVGFVALIALIQQGFVERAVRRGDGA